MGGLGGGCPHPALGAGIYDLIKASLGIWDRLAFYLWAGWCMLVKYTRRDAQRQLMGLQEGGGGRYASLFDIADAHREMRES